METPKSMENSFFLRILALLFVLLGGVILTYLIFLGITGVIAGFNPAEMQRQITSMAQNPGMIRILQFIQSICIFLLPPFVLSKMYKASPRSFLSLSTWNTKAIATGMLSIVFMIPLLNVLVAWNEGMHLPESFSSVESWMRVQEDNAARITNLLLSGTSIAELLSNLLLVAVLAGMGEELFFRGLLQKILKDGITSQRKTKSTLPAHLSIWIVAVIFSAVHFQFFGFIPRMLLGVWLGYLLWWTDSIWVPVFAHFTNNALSTLAIYGQNKGYLTENPDNIGLNNSWWLCILSIVLLALIAQFMSKKRISRH
jgi:uncharacterized protein